MLLSIEPSKLEDLGGAESVEVLWTLAMSAVEREGRGGDGPERCACRLRQRPWFPCRPRRRRAPRPRLSRTAQGSVRTDGENDGPEHEQRASRWLEKRAERISLRHASNGPPRGSSSAGAVRELREDGQGVDRGLKFIPADHTATRVIYKSASSSSGRGAAAAEASSAAYWAMRAGSTWTSGGASAGEATNSRVGFLRA